MKVVTSFLHELFIWFGVVDCIVSDNGSQFMSSEFKEFCQTFSVEHIIIALYHPRSNGQVECFIDIFKRVLRKARDIPTNIAIQQFLQVYRVTPYKNAPSATTQVCTVIKFLRNSYQTNQNLDSD